MTWLLIEPFLELKPAKRPFLHVVIIAFNRTIFGIETQLLLSRWHPATPLLIEPFLELKLTDFGTYRVTIESFNRTIFGIETIAQQSQRF